MVAAWVRLPSVWVSVCRIRSRSTSSMLRPTSAATALPAAATRAAGPDEAAPEPGEAARRAELDRFARDDLAFREQDGAMHRVLELAHIAPPGMQKQPAHGLVAKRAVGEAVHLGIAMGEMPGECRDVGRPLAQGGHGEGHDIEAEVKVLAEAPGGDLGDEVAVGGGDDAHIDLHRGRAAEPVDLALLQCAEQLRLQADVHLADLVEQERAAAGGLELADPAGDGAAEGALLVAEQLRFEQVLRDRRAVQRNERAARAARAAMQVARQHLLAGARFTRDQHRCLGTCDLLGAAHAGLHRRIAHDEGVRLPGGGFEDGGDEVGVRRQRQEFLRAGSDRADRGLGVRMAAAGDDGHEDALAGEGGDEGADVMDDLDQHEIDAGGAAQPLEPRLRIVGLVEPCAARDRDPRGLAEIAGERADDQDAHGNSLSRRGRS